MRLLIIGKNGQLGRELVHASAPPRRSAGGRQQNNLQCTAYDKSELDVTDESLVNKVLDKDAPDCIINTSAFHVVPACEDNPDVAFKVNAEAVGFLARQSKERGIRFVTYSSDYVFDGKKGAPYGEDDETGPLQVYGQSKLAGEKAALSADPRAIVIRTCGVYGGKNGSASKGGNFVLSILKEAKSKQELEVSSEQIVNPTYAPHLAQATLALLSAKPPGGIYHLASDGYCSWAEFAAEIVKAAGSSMRIISVDRSGAQSIGSKILLRPLFSALKNNKAAALGVRLPDWKIGVREYIQAL